MEDCIFCKIINKEIPASLVYEDDDVMVFNDIHPLAPVHILVIPKIHFSSLIEAKDENRELLGKLMLKVSDIAREKGLDKSGYKVFINNGKGAGQDVFHLHIHLTGGWK